MSATLRVSGIDTTPASQRKMAAGRDQSLNHLLNFSLPPRQPRALPPPRRSRRAGTTQGFWNKEKFLNAQYRFIMNPAGDYTVHFADPDIYFQWNDILQVIVPQSSALSVAGSSSTASQVSGEGNTTCPICLSPPSAPRMTKCGHIYCFPCILHYLGTSESTKWARCPICFDTVASHQLRSVHWIEAPETADSDLLEMRLMERPQITTLALPQSPTWPSDALPPHQAPFHFMPDVFAFSKFMIATSDYMIAELTRELEELATERRTLERLGDSLSVTFIESAEEKIRRQIQKAVALDTPFLRAAELRSRREADDLTARAQRRAEYEAQRANAPQASVLLDSEEIPEALLLTTGRTSRQRKNVNPPPPSTQTYYYYQAASGAPVFLHPLDIRTLVARFGSYVAFPDRITVRVEAAQEGTVDDALRKRCKYLGHVAEAADVVFIEADLRGVVGDEALAPFEAALKMRRSRRKDKDKKDDKARAKAEASERARLGIMPVQHHPGAHSPATNTIDIWEELPAELLLTSIEFPAAVSAAAQEIDTTEEDYTPPERPAVAGVWGSRSFAGVLHAPPTESALRTRIEKEDVEEEAFDSAWADLEVRTGNNSKRSGKKTKMVLLGGGGAGARRRR